MAVAERRVKQVDAAVQPCQLALILASFCDASRRRASNHVNASMLLRLSGRCRVLLSAGNVVKLRALVAPFRLWPPTALLSGLLRRAALGGILRACCAAQRASSDVCGGVEERGADRMEIGWCGGCACRAPLASSATPCCLSPTHTPTPFRYHPLENTHSPPSAAIIL